MNFTGLDAWLIVRQLLDLHIARQTIATQAERIAELEAAGPACVERIRGEHATGRRGQPEPTPALTTEGEQ